MRNDQRRGGGKEAHGRFKLVVESRRAVTPISQGEGEREKKNHEAVQDHGSWVRRSDVRKATCITEYC